MKWNNFSGYYWCDASQGIPAQAIKAGVDKDGGDIYVGRATHNGEIQPAKVLPNQGCAYVAWGGEEHRKDDYEVCGLDLFILTSSYQPIFLVQ